MLFILPGFGDVIIKRIVILKTHPLFMSSSRQLAAVILTDIVGYTALMGDNEQMAFEFFLNSFVHVKDLNVIVRTASFDLSGKYRLT